MKTRGVRRASLAAVALLAACEPEPIGPCADEWVPGIVVEVVHAQTGAPEAAGARGWVRQGAFVDSLRLPGPAWTPSGAGEPRLMYVAWERPGLYNVFLEKPGFAEWSRQGVRVNGDGCHVGTVNLRAELSPLAP